MNSLFRYTDKKQIPMFIFMIAALVVSVPLRFYLLWKATDPTNGFYTDGFEIESLAFYLIILTAVLVFIFSNIFFKRKVSLKSCGRSRSVFAFGSCFSLALVFDFVGQMLKFFSTRDMQSFYDGIMLSVTSKWPLIFQAVLALGAAFYVIVYSASNIIDNFNFKSFGAFGVFPCVWCAFRLIRCFMTEVNLINTSQRLVEMLMLIFAMLFFFEFAKLNASYRDGVKYSTIMLTGWTAAFLSFVVSVAPIAVILCGGGAKLAFTDTNVFVDFFMGIFIVSAMMKNSFTKNSAVKDTQEN